MPRHNLAAKPQGQRHGPFVVASNLHCPPASSRFIALGCDKQHPMPLPKKSVRKHGRLDLSIRRNNGLDKMVFLMSSNSAWAEAFHFSFGILESLSFSRMSFRNV